MTLVASDLIAGAVLGAYPHAQAENHAPAQLLRQLTWLDREIVSFVMLHRPELVSAAGTSIPVVAGTNPSGYALSAAASYHDFRWVDKDGLITPVRIVPESELDNPPVHPAGAVRGGTFFPADPLEVRWDTDYGERSMFVGNGDQIAYRLIPNPKTFTLLADSMTAPDEARGYVEASLILTLLLSSSVAVPAEKLQGALANLQREKALMEMVLVKKNLVTSSFGGYGD